VPAQQTVAEGDVHLSTPRVAARYDVSTRTIERWEEDEDLEFPEPDLRIYKRKYWKVKTLERWERARAASAA
jgi:lipopolysaccharide export system protein LptC